MPSKKQYNLVQNDDYDNRIPMHPDEAYHHGISFPAKFIGTLDIPRPTSRVEIVAAMRRIRYEFKAKLVKKKKVNVEVSVDGVKVSLKCKKKKKNQWTEENKPLLMHHPIYRIFYVSHDSQDLKIFSYIARDGTSNVFKCNVFKSNKKSQAMKIVRTVGQAFEVCHKLTLNGPAKEEEQLISIDNVSDCIEGSLDEDALKKDKDVSMMASDPVSCDTLAADSGVLTHELMDLHNDSEPPLSPSIVMSYPTSAVPPSVAPTGLHLDLATQTTLQKTNGTSRKLAPVSGSGEETYGTAAQHELQLMREQIEQQNQQTHAAVAQVLLLRDQLAAETAARLEAQARTHQLLVHNKELLEHIQMLVVHLQEIERRQSSPYASPQHQAPSSPRITMVPQMTVMCESQTPTLAPFYLPPELQEALLSQRLPQPQPLYPLPNYQINDLIQRLQHLNHPPQSPSSLFQPSPSAFHTSPYSGSPVMTHKLQSPPENSPSSLKSDQQQFTFTAKEFVAAATTATAPPSPKEVSDTAATPPLTNPISDQSQFIRPLSQVGTLTTTDNEGRMKVFVPVDAEEEPRQLASALEMMRASGGASDEASPALARRSHPGSAAITRSTSEKVPHRSELMSQVQRTAWARHTTK